MHLYCLADPKIPLDTNGVERGVAVARKNQYRGRSERGTRIAALVYSLFGLARQRVRAITAAVRAISEERPDP
jgi:hypothetical protein